MSPRTPTLTLRLTERQFKALKRRQIRNVQKALAELEECSAYLPTDVYARFIVVRDNLDAMAEATSVKKWGN